MAKTGPKPTPEGLRIYGSQGQNPGEKLQKVPAAPRHLGSTGKRKWKEVGTHLLRLTILEERYFDAMIVYCEAWDRKEEAEKVLREEGRYVAHARGGGKTRHPAAIEHREALDLIRRLQVEFGFTPAAATSIKVAGKTPGRPSGVASRQRGSSRGA